MHGGTHYVGREGEEAVAGQPTREREKEAEDTGGETKRKEGGGVRETRSGQHAREGGKKNIEGDEAEAGRLRPGEGGKAPRKGGVTGGRGMQEQTPQASWTGAAKQC